MSHWYVEKRIKEIARKLARHYSGDPQDQLDSEDIEKLTEEYTEMSAKLNDYYDNVRKGEL
jgi:hypothetical protein